MSQLKELKLKKNPFSEMSNWNKETKFKIPKAKLHKCLSPEKRYIRYCESTICKKEEIDAQERRIKIN